jgi:phage terminase large subunit
MATAIQPSSDIYFPAGYEYLFEPHRYKVAKGGRGGNKSWSYARALLIHAAERTERVLCARELQTSIAESVHRLLRNQISIMGLDSYFEVQEQGIYGKHNGSEFFFYGLRNNVTKVKSAEGITKCWVEEAEKVSQASWEVLVPTIREPKSEIWISFNPDEENDPTYQRFVVSPPPDCVVHTSNWHDNPWFPDALRAEKDYLYRVDPEAAAHVWGGECRRNASSQIFRGKYVVENFTAPVEAYDRKAEGWDGPYYGADWGFSQDPACLVRCWIKGYAHGKTSGKLMVDYDEGGVGIELDDLPRAFARVPGYKDYAVRGDSSRPETISHVARHGAMNIRPSEKWKGCVEDGVAYLRSFEQIVVHPRCEATQQEMRLYSYKVDRLTGDVTADIVDKHNHRIDALRYALEPLIMASRSTGAWGRLQG